MNQEKIENSIKTILLEVGEDPSREGLVKTPNRVFRAYEYICGGYTKEIGQLINGAIFDSNSTDMVVVQNIEFYSMCEHHMLPFFGRCAVAYIPDGKVIGLSKIPRIVDVFARRLQIQERLTGEIADALMNAVGAKGVAIKMSARHLCMEMRGVEKQHSFTTTTAFTGAFGSDQSLKDRFLNIVNSSQNERF